MKLHLVHGLKLEVLGDELLVLDSASGVVHRLSGAARELVEKVRVAGSVTLSDDDEVAVALVEAGVLAAEGGSLSRRAMLGFAAGLGIVTLALPTAAAAASPGSGVTGSGGTGSGGDPVTTTSTSTTTPTVAASEPDPISSMAASDISGASGAGAIRLIFTAPADNGAAITSFKVYRTVGASTTLFQTVSGSTGPLDLTGLTRGTSYTLSVAAVNGVGEQSTRSNAVTVTPAALEPDQVTGLSAASGIGFITLTFTAPANNGATITSYRVYRTQSSVDSLFMTYSGATGPIKIDMLDPVSSYTFKVAAVNSVGEGTKSASDTTTPIAVGTGGSVSYFTADGTNGEAGVKYAVHKFVNDEGGTGAASSFGTFFQLRSARQLDYLVVAAGGTGGSSSNGGERGTGGGGAGGVRQGSFYSVASNYEVGVAGTTSPPALENASGNNGDDSYFGEFFATGGGGGGDYKTRGNSGGSGGGGGGRVSTAGGSGNAGGYTPAEGNAGGNARGADSNGRNAGGGGGGAGSAGGNGAATSTVAGNGGSGITSTITGSSVVYAGGGGGGAWDSNSGASETAGTGGSGGGGAGSTSGNATAGQNGRGAGGGGAGQNGRGGAGGSGIVVVRYPVTKASY